MVVLQTRQNEIKTTKDNIVIFFYYMDIHYYNDFTKQNKKIKIKTKTKP